MSAEDTKRMIDKVALLIGSEYLSKEESDWLQQVLAINVLRQEHIDRITSIYNRIYSLKVGNG